MKAKWLWNYDGFFDYNDRWMAQEDDYAAWCQTPCPKSEGHSHDALVDAMWAVYRSTIPEQAGGKNNLKWIWEGEMKTGKFVAQP